MAESKILIEANSKSSEVERIAANIARVVKGERITDTVAACLALSILLQDNEVDDDKLLVGVRGAAGWISKYLMLNDPMPAEKMN